MKIREYMKLRYLVRGLAAEIRRAERQVCKQQKKSRKNIKGRQRRKRRKKGKRQHEK